MGYFGFKIYSTCLLQLNVNPDDLIPKLPKPKDLQPFPTTQALVYQGHEGIVRCLSVDPTGQWLVSGTEWIFILTAYWNSLA